MIWSSKTYSEILATGKFVSARLVRVLIEKMGGVTYSAQYTTDSKRNFRKYYQEDGPRFPLR
jgi:hypothetical protein